ncbi:MAG: hypothetical protein SAJ72_22100 [Jaaginema sp. PMC 1080.18]|nr:hypothetical protein [Jaaginema sp. PMC 1080.18]
MSQAKFDIRLVKISEHPNEFSSCVISPDNEERGTIFFQHPTLGDHSFEDKDTFGAFCKMRLFLEKQGWQILCNGARVDAYPSGMSRDMCGGIKLYILKMGQKTQRSDLVKIFDPAELENVGTVEEQRRYYQEWQESHSYPSLTNP